MTIVDVACVLFLVYYSAALRVVAFHSSLDACNAPCYTYGPLSGKILWGAVWPVTAHVNGELAWHLTACLASVPVIAALWWLVGLGINNEGARSGIVMALMIVPVGGHIVGAVIALIAAVAWKGLVEPFGGRVPPGV